jgi:hypothetical protein
LFILCCEIFIKIFSIVGSLGASVSIICVAAKIFGLITTSWLIVLFPAIFPLLGLALIMLASLPEVLLKKEYNDLYGDEG